MLITDFNKWKPNEYLKQYYKGTITEDENIILSFIIDFLKKENTSFSDVIDFGCGPTIHHIIPIAPYVEKIYMADYLDSNLNEINKWVKNDKESHNWDLHIKGVLELENLKTNKKNIKDRTSLIKNKVVKLMHCDIFKDKPLNKEQQFSLVTSFFCADSVTHSKEAWGLAMKNIFKIIKPGGWIITSALKEAAHYKVGDLKFPSANINESDMINIFQNNDEFDKETIQIKVFPISVWQNEGFNGIIVAKAKKR